MDKKLKLMKYWLFGLFVFVFAGLTAYMYLWTKKTNILMAIQSGWSIWGITAVLCILAYYGYKWFLGRK
jgi:hypothetical protein